MSWLDKILPSRIRAEKESKGSVPEGLWHKCLNCDTVIYRAEFEKNLNVCPKCNNHGRISARTRADIILDTEHRIEIFDNIMPSWPNAPVINKFFILLCRYCIKVKIT